MPILQCPECNEEIRHTGSGTAVTCPVNHCGAYVPVGGPAKEREGAGLSIDDIRDRLAERNGRTTPPQ